MTLGEIINKLKEYDPETQLNLGFTEPHSYRGYYEQLAFEPCKNTTIGRMLECCKKAKSGIFEGYKGGEYTYDDDTECNMAWYGCSGEVFSVYLLDYILRNTETEFLHCAVI